MFLGALHLFPSDLFPNMYLLSFFQPHLNYADFHFFVAIVLFGLSCHSFQWLRIFLKLDPPPPYK